MIRAMLLWLLALPLACSGADVKVLNITTLGPDPPTVNRLNGESFQQDALVTFQGMLVRFSVLKCWCVDTCSCPGWQYAVHYLTDVANSSVRHPSVSRRLLPAGDWDTLTLDDYSQTEDDGHDMCAPSLAP